MKRLILIFIPLFIFATPKKKLNECEKEVIRLTTLIEAKKEGDIIIQEPTNRKDVKIAKIESKQQIKETKANTKETIVLSREGTKQRKSDNKKEVKVNPFRNFTKMITKSVWALGLYTMIAFVVIRLFEGAIKASPIGGLFNFKK